MGLFSRDRDDEDNGLAAPVFVPAPHPALASLETFRDASLAEAAAAVLMLGYQDAKAGEDRPRSQITLRAQELFGPAVGLKGAKLLMHFQDLEFGLVVNEALGVLSRSILVDITHTGSSMGTNVSLTRRGRRALDSGAPERWIDVPADPA